MIDPTVLSASVTLYILTIQKLFSYLQMRTVFDDELAQKIEEAVRKGSTIIGAIRQARSRINNSRKNTKADSGTGSKGGSAPPEV